MRAASALATLLAAPTAHAQLMISSNSSFEVNHQTTSQNACSHGDKEWYICTQPEGWGAMFYCPAYSDFNETELATVEWGGFGVPTPLTPCFTCPAEGSTCNETNAEVMTAAGIPEDAVTALGGWDVWGDNVYYCEQLCELNKPGEACSRDDPCINGRAFCDYDTADVVDFDNATEGICRQCPDDPLAMCHQEGLIVSDEYHVTLEDTVDLDYLIVMVYAQLIIGNPRRPNQLSDMRSGLLWSCRFEVVCRWRTHPIAPHRWIQTRRSPECHGRFA